MSEPRILLFYITHHSGHHKAAISIQRAINIVNPHSHIQCIDAFNYTNPVMNRIAHKTYMQVIRRRPEVWEYLYDNPNIVLKTQRLKALIHKYNSRKLINLIKDVSPHVIICTQAFPCGMVADLKKYQGLQIPLIGVVTDYVTHSFWFYDTVDMYVVPDESSRDKMINNGISEDRIKILGIPVKPEFNDFLEKTQIIRKLNLDSTIPTILVMGGGRGLGNIKQIVHLLYKIDIPFQMIVLAGVNKSLFNYLKRKQKKWSKRKKILVYGYVDNVHELMTVSDILISKPGGITTAEALAKGLPMVIFNPLPGQERSNTEFLLKIGAAIKCEHLSDLPILIKDLFLNRDKLKIMSMNARRHGHPDSSLKIAREVLVLIEKR
ncbi:MAG TPA: glycosyltransferase [Candidatus Omnitrophica bacterium]|nr:glycosyltransferase [Candidatus Omnitrophota bacterium]